MVLGVDVGGTFTDLALWDGSGLRIGKVPSTPDQAVGVVSGAGDLTGGRRVDAFLHGTTVATNALLERRGARTALVTSAGFEDVLEIGRQDRPSLYDSFVDRPHPLVPASLRFSVAERSGPPTDKTSPVGDVASVVDAVAKAAPEAVAIALLYAFADLANERALAAALTKRLPGVPVSSSAEVVAEFREFERTSTTVLNAYLAPRTGGYLRGLVARAVAAGLADDVAVMRSSGGLIGAATAAAFPAAVLLSGPAGGVVAAGEIGRAMGREHLISFDMGGTSTDVCRIDHGRPEVSYERPIDGYPCRLPSVAVHTVGAGGGSIAWVDPGGALRVGPQSAGATPGPACYGHGGSDATVTDANLALGRLDASARLAGSLGLHAGAAHAALAGLGGVLGLGPQAAAGGVVEIVEAHMARAIRRVSVEEGADPRRAALVAFGGAGGLHATALARGLDMSGVIVPPYAGVFSAVGLLLSPPRADAARTILIRPGDAERLDVALAEVAEAATRELASAHRGAATTCTFVDARYRGQSHETVVPFDRGMGWAELEARFHRAHAERNGFAREGDEVEAVTVRAEAVGTAALRWDELPPVVAAGEAQVATRRVVTSDGAVDAAVYRRAGLAPGAELVGPAIVEEPEATTYLGAGERATVHESGALEVEW